MKVNSSPDEGIKVMEIKILTELCRRMEEQNENFNKDIESKRNFQIEVTQIKIS